MRMVPQAVAVLALIAAASLPAQEQPAPSPPPSPASPPPDKPAAPPEKPAEKKNPSAAFSAEGLVVQSESGDYRLQLRCYAQVDGRFFSSHTAALASDTFLLRRARPIFLGTVAKYFDFNITPDFGGGTTVLQDAYLDARYSTKLRLQVGKFKAP